MTSKTKNLYGYRETTNSFADLKSKKIEVERELFHCPRTINSFSELKKIKGALSKNLSDVEIDYSFDLEIGGKTNGGRLWAFVLHGLRDATQKELEEAEKNEKKQKHHQDCNRVISEIKRCMSLVGASEYKTLCAVRDSLLLKENAK